MILDQLTWRLIRPFPGDLLGLGPDNGRKLVEQLANEAERVNDVIMLARRKGEQLCF